MRVKTSDGARECVQPRRDIYDPDDELALFIHYHRLRVNQQKPNEYVTAYLLTFMVYQKQMN